MKPPFPQPFYPAAPPAPLPLGLGSWVFGGRDYWGETSRKESRKVILDAFAGGIRHFDTAPAYGKGEAEQILGQTLISRRNSAILASKFFPTLPANVAKTLRRTLGRLCTDRLDIFYLHWPNEKCDIRGIMEELTVLREKGLIGSIGVSNFSPDQMEEAGRWGRIDCCQTAYSLLWRRTERELLPYCRERGIAVGAYSPLAQGLAAEDPRSLERFSGGRSGLIFLRPELRPALSRFLAAFRKAAGDEGRSAAGTALRWVIERQGIALTLAGARTPGQLAGLLEQAAVPLPERLSGALDDLSREFRQELDRLVPDAENIWDHRRD